MEYKRIGTVDIATWTDGVPVEDSVWKQVENIAAVPGVERIALMPDTHLGNGACVGCAILTRDIIIPAAVGVDIGCGMIAAPTNLVVDDLTGKKDEILYEIERQVPVGRTNNGGPGDKGAWETPPFAVETVWKNILLDDYQKLITKYPKLNHSSVVRHLGTLGTGNHFIEVQQEVGTNRLWVMLHSGSRGVGNAIGSFFTAQARKEMERWHITLPDPELAYLPINSELGHNYLTAIKWAQEYAYQSRLIMLSGVYVALTRVLGKLVFDIEQAVHIHHNYLANEKHFGKPGWVSRKGAINADKGVRGIIPSNMGNVSYITEGQGCREALNTSSHGAGRVMSRGAARKTFSLEDFQEQVGDVTCRKDQRSAAIDEAPLAYKNIESVMDAQIDLTIRQVALKQLIVAKG